MSILDALEALRAAPAASRERDRAGRALLEELRMLCAAGCTWNRAVAGRPPTYAKIPPADRDDVAQAVATKILVRNPLNRLLEGTPSLAEQPDALSLAGLERIAAGERQPVVITQQPRHRRVAGHAGQAVIVSGRHGFPRSCGN